MNRYATTVIISCSRNTVSSMCESMIKRLVYVKDGARSNAESACITVCSCADSFFIAENASRCMRACTSDDRCAKATRACMCARERERERDTHTHNLAYLLHNDTFLVVFVYFFDQIIKRIQKYVKHEMQCMPREA